MKNPVFEAALNSADCFERRDVPAWMDSQLRVLDGAADRARPWPKLAYVVSLFRLHEHRFADAWNIALAASGQTLGLEDTLMLSLAMGRSVTEGNLIDRCARTKSMTAVSEQIGTNVPPEVRDVAWRVNQQHCRIQALQYLTNERLVSMAEVQDCYNKCNSKWLGVAECTAPYDDLLQEVAMGSELVTEMRRPSGPVDERNSARGQRERARRVLSHLFDTYSQLRDESRCTSTAWVRGTFEYLIGDLCLAAGFQDEAVEFASKAIGSFSIGGGICDRAIAEALMSRCKREVGDYEGALAFGNKAWATAQACQHMHGAKRAGVLLTRLAATMSEDSYSQAHDVLRQMVEAIREYDDRVFREIVCREAVALRKHFQLPKPPFWHFLVEISRNDELNCAP